jgi:hypothetical protein
LAITQTASAFYRCYLLNYDNSFRESQEFRGFSDEEAKQRAVAWLDLSENSGAQGVELWTGDERILTRQRGLLTARAATD